MTVPMTTPLSRKTRILRRLIKSLIWGGSMTLLGWSLGFQPTWQLLVMVVAAMVIDNMLDAWLPSSVEDEAQAKALIEAEQAGYRRGVHETKLASATTGKPA